MAGRWPGQNIHTPLNVFDQTLTAAGTVVGGTVDQLAGMRSLLAKCKWDYTSGSGSTDVYLQTTVDGGSVWFDVANWHCVDSDLDRAYNLAATTAVTTVYTVTDKALGQNSCKDGLLGSALRVVTVSTAAGTAACTVTALAKD